jgi:beta-lactamase regulating signal transducer with metallopeptidase domain/thiol-disulfide isomerase/thioredoxin
MPSIFTEPYSLGSIAVRSFALLLLTACIAFSFRRRSAAVLHGIWTVGLGACLAIPFVMLSSPSWYLPLLPPETSGALTSPDLAIPQQPSLATDIANPAPIGDERSIANQPPAARQTIDITPPAARSDGQTVAQSNPTIAGSRIEWPTLGSVALGVWAAGFIAILLRLLHPLVSGGRTLREASDVDDADWCSERDIAARLLGLRANVALKRHSGAVSPMVVGLFRPVVLLPDDADTWSHERRRLVLLHELAHVQRRDVLTQSLATLACAVYWFNPIAWWGASQMKRLREIACDDAVVTHSSVPANYAQTLLDVARRYRCRSMARAVAMARSSNVESRITAILSPSRSRAILTTRSLRAFAAVSLIVAAVAGTCQLSSRADEAAADDAKQAVTEKQVDESRTMQVRVLDEAGKPLSDAHLHVSTWEMKGAKDYPNRDLTTDAQGRVEVEIPRRLRIMRMWPAKAGYVPLFVNFAEGKHEEGRLIPDEYEFRLPKGQRLSGRVVDEEGKPIADAQVQVMVDVDEPAWGAKPDAMISTWLTDDDFNCPTPVTDADGRWFIDNAPAPLKKGKKDYEFRLQVTHPNFAGDTRWGELQQKQAISTADLRAGDATLTLDRGIAISGKISGPDGKTVTRGLVVWSDDPYLGQGENETAIDGDGHYETKRLAPGKYPITVLAPGFAPWQQTIELNRDLGDLDIQLEPGNPIQIKFVDPAGEPIPDVYVGIGEWRGTEAIFNHKHPNVPDSGIPRNANDDGVYEWDWAPEDAVNYWIEAEGFARQEMVLVAMPEPHVITLAPDRVVVGTVTDASTGKPIERFSAMPVIVFRLDFYSTRTEDAKVGQAGQYELPLTGSADPNDRYRVRFEAEGYRSVVSNESFGPHDGRTKLDYALQPAPARSGRVVDANGQPVADATVLQASPTEVQHTSNGQPKSYSSRPIRTDAEGRFQLLATTEPVRVRAYHDLGFAEKALAPNEAEAGELKLEPWATVSGRLMQAGRPVAGETIYFYSLVRRGLIEARFQDSFHAKTDADGNFQFDRISPMSGTLKAYLGPWQDSPLTSSESVPLVLGPGEHREVTLGGDGATINGRVVATGRDNQALSKQWSINYLINRSAGVEYPDAAQPLSFDPNGTLQPTWLRQPDFQSWVSTRQNHFVKLADDGRLQIHGVEPGEYDLVIQLYEEPAGCLVETIGEKVVPVTVTADDVASGKLNIGDIDVECRIGPRVGSDMRVFKFTDANGRVRQIDDLQGQHVLLHVWATWCAPCVESIPMLKATVNRYSESSLTVVGLNIDEEARAAKEMAGAQQMDWAQNYLGSDSELMRQLAVSTAPAYYLIGPDGKLVGSASQWEKIEQLLRTEIE